MKHQLSFLTHFTLIPGLSGFFYVIYTCLHVNVYDETQYSKAFTRLHVYV